MIYLYEGIKVFPEIFKKKENKEILQKILKRISLFFYTLVVQKLNVSSLGISIETTEEIQKSIRVFIGQ